jgi:streptomycin 6-kinase
VSDLTERWSLAIEDPFPGLSYNYVAPVTRVDGTPAVLKLWFPFEQEFLAEAEALRLYDGDGAVRLLDLDISDRAMLLERAEPGYDLWSLDDAGQIDVTGALLRRLWRPPPDGSSLPLATDQWQRMAKVAPGLARDGFPLDRVPTACAVFYELAAAAPPVLLHEDLHQANILAAQREPWLAIDPHGLIGPPVLDTIQMILNVLWREPDATAWPRLVARYVAALAEATGLDREQVRLCGAARGVLEAFWTLEDEGTGWEQGIAIADAFEAAEAVM